MSYPAKEAYRKEEVAGRYDADRFTRYKGRFTHKREMAVIMKALDRAGVRPPARLLDVPCGTGRLSLHLALRGFKAIGLDISMQMISQARREVEQFHLRDKIAFTSGDAEALPYHNDSFEVAVSLRLFGHTPPESRRRIL